MPSKVRLSLDDQGLRALPWLGRSASASREQAGGAVFLAHVEIVFARSNG
jgi:hypothetical protein